jgi:hypothetical protein
MKLTQLFESHVDVLYHTTDPYSAEQILSHRQLQPKNNESFVSLSRRPHLHDIQAHGCCLVFDGRMLSDQLDEVDYSETWAEAHPAQVAYIAGEGWVEQWEAPEPDEDGWEDEDAHEEAYRYAEQDAFFSKSDEDEFISKQAGQPVRFLVTAVLMILVENPDDEWRELLDKLGYAHAVIKKTMN